MGWFSALTGRSPVVEMAQADNNPVSTALSVVAPPEVFGLASYDDPVAVVSAVTRETARQVPAITAARNKIAGTIATFNLQAVSTTGAISSPSLFNQPEGHVVRSVSIAQLVEDLLYDGVALWRVRTRDFTGKPSTVERIARHRWSADGVQVRVDGRAVPAKDVIRFDSPHEGWLSAGARAIRTSLRLESAAALAAEGLPPMDYFSPAEGADPITDAAVTSFLGRWINARKARRTAYVPAALKYNTVAAVSAREAQLVEARQHAVLEIARLTGVSPEDLGSPVTSRTYTTWAAQRRDFIDTVLSPYLEAIQARLSLDDVLAHGTVARFDLSTYLADPDPKARYESYSAGFTSGVLTADDLPRLRATEGLPPLEQEVTE